MIALLIAPNSPSIAVGLAIGLGLGYIAGAVASFDRGYQRGRRIMVKPAPPGQPQAPKLLPRARRDHQEVTPIPLRPVRRGKAERD